MAKSLLKLSFTLKNVSTLSKYASHSRLCYTTLQGKETSNSTGAEIVTSKELFELIKNNDNPVRLLALIEANKKTVDGRHIVLALTSMQKFYKANSMNLQNVKESQHFKYMSSILQNHVMRLDMPQLIQSLKILTLLEVPSSTMMVQSLLQVIRHSINDLRLQEIYYLSFLLRNMTQTNLGEAIMTALPEVFKAQLKLQIDRENLTELTNALRYSKDYAIDKEIVEYIVDGLIKINDPMDIDTAVHILWHISDIHDLPNNYDILLHKVLAPVQKNINLLNDVEAMQCIKKMSRKIAKGVDTFYKPVLLDNLINRIVIKDVGFINGMNVLRSIHKFKHINMHLLDYLSSTCEKHFLTERPFDILTLMSGLANADYKPSTWDRLQNIILNTYSLLPDHVGLCYLALYLAAFDCFDEKILKIVFTADDNPALLTDKYRLTLQQLYQTVKTLYPNYTGPWPIEGVLESFKTVKTDSTPKNHLIYSALERVLGGSDYLMNNMKTQLGHEIDHLIIMNNGCPIPVQQSSDANCCIEDLDIPSDAQRVAVLLLPSSVYCKNIKRLLSTVSLNVRSLEAMSYTVVKISIEDWLRMPEFEKLPYLSHLIGLKNEKIIDQTAGT